MCTILLCPLITIKWGPILHFASWSSTGICANLYSKIHSVFFEFSVDATDTSYTVYEGLFACTYYFPCSAVWQKFWCVWLKLTSDFNNLKMYQLYMPSYQNRSFSVCLYFCMSVCLYVCYSRAAKPKESALLSRWSQSQE